MSKITLQEFWNSKEKLAIHCKTEEQAKELCEAFDKMGKKWCSGRSYIEDYKNNWCYYKTKTCYSNQGEFTYLLFYKNAGYKIYEFEDVIFEEEKQMTDNVKKVFEMLGVEPNEEFKIRGGMIDNNVKLDEELKLYYVEYASKTWVGCSSMLYKILNGTYTIVKLPKKKKLRDLTAEEYKRWEEKCCIGYDGDYDCKKCLFKHVTCGSNDVSCWVNHKDLYSDKFLDQEVEIPNDN